MKSVQKERVKNVIIFIGMILMISGYTFSRVLGDMDEIWMFNFGKCIADGLLPYKDFSIIVTPLLPMVLSIFLKIFGEELIVVRVLEIAQSAIILFLTYKILLKLNVNKALSLIGVIVFFNINSCLFRFNYSWTVVLFLLVILYFELDKEKEFFEFELKKNFILGIIAGLAILTKQTTGIVLAVCFIGYKVLMIDDLKDLKKFGKIFGIRLAGVLIPLLVFTIYLVSNNIFTDFVDYTISGIKTFSNYISYFTLMSNRKLGTIILAYIVPITLLVGIGIYLYGLIKGKIRKKDWFKNLYILLAYSSAGIFAVVPLADSIHFAIGSIATIILSIYLLNIIIRKFYGADKYKEIIKKILLIITICLFVFNIWSSMELMGLYVKALTFSKELNHFKYIAVEEPFYKLINEVGNYALDQEEKGKKVYILHYAAACFNIPIDKYYKNYDLFNIGNFGSRGEEGIIEDLDNDKDCLVLVINSSDYSQNPNRVIEHVINNYKLVDSIDNFAILEKEEK